MKSRTNLLLGLVCVVSLITTLALASALIVREPVELPDVTPAPSSAVAIDVSEDDPVVVEPTRSPRPESTPVFRRLPTRIVIKRLKIDLAVVRQVGGPYSYPLCGVAQRLPGLDTIDDTYPTYLYGHAQRGMFGPLLGASLPSSRIDLIGLQVLLYSDDNRVYTYVIDEVHRHTHSLLIAAEDPLPHLWLQTSETWTSDGTKLMVRASLSSWEPTDQASAHPKANAWECG